MTMFTMEVSAARRRAPHRPRPAVHRSARRSATRTDDRRSRAWFPTATATTPEAAAEFPLTQDDLLDRRRDDADLVADALHAPASPSTSRCSRTPKHSRCGVRLDADEVSAWLRTLTAVRLVMATRLGIEDDTADDDDPASASTTGWASARGLLQAIER
jgi:hypothetical protein